MPISDLLTTDIHLAQLLGELDEREEFFVVRTPSNPGFYYGNLLVLKNEPRSVSGWIDSFEREFGESMGHRCVAWSGEPLAVELLAEAVALGLETEGSAEMVMAEAPVKRDHWEVRPLDLVTHWDASVALNIASDVTEQVGDQSFKLFKERLRATWRQWIEMGFATWWGVFDGDQLVGQCGMVFCGELGRFQAVETHPHWRRRGVCGDLISTVARDALGRGGMRRVLLSAEIDGPALKLYRSLGFADTGHTHSLLKHEQPLVVRIEREGDHAGVRSLVAAAYGSDAETQAVEDARACEDAIALVAEQTNSLFGQLLFKPLRFAGSDSDLSVVRLECLAVKPGVQNRGIGARLIKDGLDACRQAGHDLCLVVGSPGYFARFGFVSAVEHGFVIPWDLGDEYFQVLELTEGALAKPGNRAVYLDAFGAS